MLQIKHLSMTHQLDLKEIVRDLSFTVNPGDKLAIIGEEGNGKSTLLKWINQDPSIENYIHVEGECINHFSRTVYLPQMLPEALNSVTLEQFFFGQSEANRLDYAELYALVGQMGLDAERLTSQQSLGSLSGGEKIKVQLLKLLALQPDLLLLDEPSNDLDIETVNWLEHFIQTTPLTILYISHDEALLRATANKILHIELLRHKTLPVATFASLDYATYVEEKLAAFDTQSRIASKQREEHDKKMAKQRRIESSVHDAQNAISRQDPAGARLLKKKMHAVKAMGKRFEREKEGFEEIPIKEDPILVKFSNTQPLANGKTILHLDNLQVKLGNQLLADSVNLLVRGPQKIGIIGQNGVGKSTFLKQLWEDLKERPDIKAGYMPQNYRDFLPETQTPIEFLSETGHADELTQIMTYLGSMRFTSEEMHHPVSALSGGQQAKLFLLKIDLAGQNVLLLDEPTRNFSPLSQPELRALFQQFEGAILVISHDRQFLKEVCEFVYELTPTGLVRKSDFV
ncbi:ATP-binding cassette domain-containing protein [Enterococcus thailandicus]|uniref:ATP-binding cassette domain-containing protein n=1 Tax=Enterococcus thailandicus TaxID=417368 RepID=UPI00288E208D|nr:ATP-binding cassette domain-containing protein [Enterococcus thailandicus]MDT2777462.1 ATP-binding cassette domain-containing protein [Enterococcus thailandicus]